MLFPWQHTAWRRLLQDTDRIPQALLLEGPEGIGKSVFAQHLAKQLLCLTPTNDQAPCGVCQSCLWFENQSHPDFIAIELGHTDKETEPSAKTAGKRSGELILVEAIRQLDDILYQTTYTNKTRVVFINPLDRLHLSAANAFLKKLEEPPKSTQFILVTAKKNRLLPTILSRCYCFCPGIPTKAQAIAWLSDQKVSLPEKWLARAQSPLDALLLAQSGQDEAKDLIDRIADSRIDPILLAEQLEKQVSGKKNYDRVEQLIALFQKITYDLIYVKQAIDVRYHPDLQKQLDKLAQKTSSNELMLYEQKLITYKKESSHPLNLRLFIEQLLITCPFI